MVLRRGRTLIGSHFLSALADGSGGDVAFSVAGHGWGRITRGLRGLRNSVAKVTLGAGSHPLSSLAGDAGSEQASLGGPATLALHQLLGPLRDRAPLLTIFTKAFIGP